MTRLQMLRTVTNMEIQVHSLLLFKQTESALENGPRANLISIVLSSWSDGLLLVTKTFKRGLVSKPKRHPYDRVDGIRRLGMTEHLL